MSTTGTTLTPMTDWQQQHVETGSYPSVTYLLIDDAYIRHMEGVQRVACQIPKHPEPVVTAEKPWEGDGVWMHNGWLYDDQEQVVKLWYHCHDPSFGEEYPHLRWNTGGPMPFPPTHGLGRSRTWVSGNGEAVATITSSTSLPQAVTVPTPTCS